MERSIALLLGLTGNWGKKGTGTRSWAIFGFDGQSFLAAKGRLGQEAAFEARREMQTMRRMLAQDDPTMTDELTINRGQMFVGRFSTAGSRLGGLGGTFPTAFMWYYQYGYKDRMNRKDWQDPSMKRSIDEYVNEALDKGWWDNTRAKVWRDVSPRVLFESGGNVLRRQRGGQVMLLEHLWPKLKMIVSVDYRITTTGLYSDYILPAAQHYEKFGFSMPAVHHLNTVLIEPAADPPGEAKTDRQIGLMILQKIEDRAKARGLKQFTNRDGEVINLEGMVDYLTLHGALNSDEVAFDEALRDNACYGILPEGTSLDTLRQKGYVRARGWGTAGHGLSQSSTIKPDETHNPFRWHTDDKMPYPTLTRRAQFYIDHEWFQEAGEELPVHKETPKQGGKREFFLTSGHMRWSVHSMNLTNNIIMNTHRGTPFMFMNDKDAAKKGIKNGEEVRVVNDAGTVLVPVKISPSARPGQVILYNGFEPYMHRDWYSESDIEPGLIKWLGMAAGYGHLQYRMFSWQPIPCDRAVMVDVERITRGARK